ncbi:MAG TPA: hypothetical protein PKW63_04825 [Vicinamibacterales bacterium]|nr:hypothetical protein [Vicinamibacterales bacterium]
MREFYRSVRAGVGPAIIGISAWCAAGTVGVISSDSGAGRLLASAPWWAGLLAFALAACVPTWRARPITAVPALLSTMPWWPIPLPAAALVWTGALAWVPIGASLLAAEGSRTLGWLNSAIGAQTPDRATRVAALGSLVIALGAAWAADPRVPGGDEPHYLVITQSLLKDGDLFIENNHTARDYASYFGGSIAPDYLVRGKDGRIPSIHAPGVSALVLPGFALFGFRGAQATLILLFAVTGALLWQSAWRLTGDASAAWFAWAAVAGSTTMAVLSFMVFPDAPGACAVAAGVWLLVALPHASGRAVVSVSAALAALPWLHTRFSVLAGALGLALLVLMLRDKARPMAGRLRRVALFSALPAISAVAWLTTFYVLYGSFDPRVPYGPNPEIRSWIWGAVTGLFVDQQFGLMTFAPVLLAAGLGVMVNAPRRLRLLSALSIAIVLAYAMAVASYWMWWAGVPGLPSRFMTAALPLLALPLAVAWSRSGAANRRVMLAGLLVSLAITALVLSVDRGAMAWNDRRAAQAAWLEWLNPLVNLPGAWPSFFWDTEVAFLRHAAASLAVLAVWWLALRTFATSRTIVATGMLVGFMLLTQVGWWVTGSAPLEAARAQLVIHAAAGAGESIWRVGGGMRRWDRVAEPLRLGRFRPPISDRQSAAVISLANVPGGLYRLDVTSGSLAGTLTVRIARPPAPALYRFDVPASSSHSFQVTLPAGAAALVVEGGAPEFARQVHASLAPASVAQAPGAFARQFAAYGDAGVFFLDGNVFPETQGFWVRGGRSTSFVLARGGAAANRGHVLQVQNGGAANTVTIQVGGWQEVLTMAAGEVRPVTLPAADALGSWPITITSSSGFRPSDTAGQDARFLGVWIPLNR